MDNLTERLLGENFEEALDEVESENGPLDAVRIYREAIRDLHRLLATAKAEGAAEVYEALARNLQAEIQAISALFPDDATHKHAQTGESLYDNIQDALRDLAKAKADLAAAREDVARMIELDRQYLAGMQQGYIWGLAGEGEKYAEACAARAGQIRAARARGGR